jgi:hypothetical protein
MRYIESGLAGIERDQPRGAPPTKMNVARLVELTLTIVRMLADSVSTRGVSKSLDERLAYHTFWMPD